MTEPANPAQADQWDAAAGEYVLGLLPEDERVAFEAKLAADPQLEQDVAAWAMYFTCFTEELEEVLAPPQIMRRIEAKLFPTVPKSAFRSVLPYALGAMFSGLLAWVAFRAGLLDLL